ncbi:MAG: 16S rRNA (cytidine(1402)-2'-O)-methyltransferase [Oscillospiraceae bacterium]|nr:16S rRNA (cytidine(1402)-2'-O)-methyltransferase [Oscillospiraceae bacterium]
MAGTLYLVPTPIGNLGDISRRMAEMMEQADFIAAEDTRVTVKLLNHLDIKKPMVTYHRHNCEQAGAAILSRLQAGESCALVTDAGTPAISDPGEDLVALCAAAGVPVVAVPGPCALITALSVSGLPTARFTFEGFLPMNKKNRRAHLDSLRQEQRTMIFYEAPHKLTDTLDDLLAVFGGERRISLCRELTKLHEEVLRTTLEGAVAHYAGQEPRGEYVLVVEGAPEAAEEADPDEALRRVLALREGGMSLKDAAAQAAAEFGMKKRRLYDMALGKEP